MTDRAGPFRASGPTRNVLIAAVAAIVWDVLVAALALADWHAYSTADKNASVVAGDDPGFFVVNFTYVALSAVRCLVLAGFVVALLSWRAGDRRDTSSVFRAQPALVAVVVVLEAGYIAASWSEPDGWWCAVRIATIVASAIATGIAFMTVPFVRDLHADAGV